MTETTHRLKLDSQTQAAIDGLDDGRRQQLDALIVAADRTQREQIAQAIDGAMAVIPAPFRKRVRKMIMG